MKHSARSKRLETEEKLRLLEKEQVRRRARKDISFFSENCFTPQFFGRQEEIKNPKHIKRWYRELQKPFRWRLQLAPRGSAKSYSHSIIYPLWRIIKNPDVRILICSSNASQAESFLRGIKGAIENDQLFNYYFPETMPVRPTLWTTSEIIVNRKSLERNPTVSTAGATGAIVSQRADLIIADDIIDDDNVITKNQREKVKAWFWKTMHPILVDGGQLLVCGTRWSPFDLYGELIKDWTALKDNEVKVTVDKAILDDEKKKVLWPEEMPYETLEKLRQQQPLFFRCSYQNEVAQLLESYFNIGDIKYFDPKEIDFSKLHIYMGVDPAISQADKGSYFAIVVVGLDDDQNIFVLHTYRAKVSIEQQVREIFARVRKFDPEGIGIDSSAYQDALRQIVETRKKEENLPIKVKRIYTRVDKFHKLLVLADKFESGKMFLRRDQHNLFEEIVSFPKGTNDLLDALHLAVDTSVERIKIGFELL